jgi:hypothetical protein
MARKVNKEDALDSAGKRDRKRKRKTTVNGCPAYRHTGTPSDPLHCVGVAFGAHAAASIRQYSGANCT